MLIGLLTVTIEISHSQSLKDKRQVVKSLITRIRDKINVSAAEVDSLDLWQRAVLGFVTVSNDGKRNDQQLENVVQMIENDPQCAILSIEREVV
jgi:uncharacterized protein YlxP (DUF503 family)